MPRRKKTMPFRGFRKNPLVLLRRLNVHPSLTTYRLNVNGDIELCSLDNVQVGSQNVSNDALDVNNRLNNNDVSEDITQNFDNNLIVIRSEKKKLGRPRQKEYYTMPSQTTKTSKKRGRKSKKIHKCNKCSKIFKNVNHLKNHDRFKHSKRQSVCGYCQKIYVIKTYYERHVALHCKICYKLQRNVNQLNEHILTCKDKEIDNGTAVPNAYICDICTDQFVSQCSMAFHKASVHSDKPPSLKDLYYTRMFDSTKVYVCYFCKDSSVDKDYLESHVTVLRNMGIINSKYPCDQCTETYNTDDELIHHKLSHATTDTNVEPIQNVTEAPILETMVMENISTVPRENANTVRDYGNILNGLTLSPSKQRINHSNNRSLRYHCKKRLEHKQEGDEIVVGYNGRGRLKCVKDMLEIVEIRYELTDVWSTYCANPLWGKGQMCEKYFMTNFALLRHMKVHHLLQRLSCKLCRQYLTTSQSHQCSEIKHVRAKREADSICTDDDSDCMDIDYPTTPPVVPQPETDIKSLRDDLVFNIVFREVPIEF